MRFTFESEHCVELRNEKFKHFDLNEREKIEKFVRKGKSLRFVSKTLDRSVSSVSDEVKNNSVKKGRYTAKKAAHKAYVKRETSKRDCLKVAMDMNLKKFVIEPSKTISLRKESLDD